MTGRYRVAGVFAHPDDETFTLGGSMLLHQGRVDYTLIVATSGEAGEIAAGSEVARGDLGPVREDEQREAVALAGNPDATIHFLGYPDGELEEVPRDEAVEVVTALLVGARPHIVVTFNTQGITLHEDHIAICEITTEAFHRARERAAREDGAFARLYYNAVPMRDLQRFWATLERAGIDLGDPDAKYMPHGTPDEEIGVLVDVRSVYQAKRRALGAHRTQAGGLVELPEHLQRQLLGREAFIRAWPPRSPGEPVAGSLFEGLPDPG